MVAFYLNVPLSELGTFEKPDEIRKVELRAHATELVYGDAAQLQGLAQERWPELDWRVEHVSTRRFIVKGEPKIRGSRRRGK